MNIKILGISIMIRTGAVIPILLMFPNIIWMILPKNYSNVQNTEPLVLTIVENIGRIGILLLPFFYDIDLNRRYSKIIIIFIILLLLVYYSSWIRYFLHGRTYELMKSPFLGIPIPLAVSPILILLCSSYLMNSWIMLIVSVIFGISHIWISIID